MQFNMDLAQRLGRHRGGPDNDITEQDPLPIATTPGTATIIHSGLALPSSLFYLKNDG